MVGDWVFEYFHDAPCEPVTKTTRTAQNRESRFFSNGCGELVMEGSVGHLFCKS